MKIKVRDNHFITAVRKFLKTGDYWVETPYLKG
jgi:hypothetical protein